jgi:hypothetical protein
VDRILDKHLSFPTPLARWLFKKAFDEDCLLSIESVQLNKHKDFRKVAGNTMAYGETDVEIVGSISRGKEPQQVAILIENKVDADQMPNQGLRYQARAECENQAGSWSDSRCLLVGPQSYLDSQYPSGAHAKDGWDAVISLEEISSVLETMDQADAETLISATQSANSWNKPIPAAVQFWEDYAAYQRTSYPSIPVFIKASKGSRAGGVWPSFFDSDLRKSSLRPERKRVQIVHMETSNYITLFIKKVAYEDFEIVVRKIMESDMNFAKPGGSWQSIQIPVPGVYVLKSLDLQTKQLDEVFSVAKRVFEFFLKHEQTFLSIPLLKK